MIRSAICKRWPTSLIPVLAAILFTTVASSHQANAQKPITGTPLAGGRGRAPQEQSAHASHLQAPAVKKVDVAAWGVLAHGVADNKVSKRTNAIVALGTIGARPEVVRLIEAGLADKDSDVRRIAAATLGEIRARRSIPKLKQAVEDDAPEVSFTAATALWQMGDRTGRSIFLDVLAGDRSTSRGIVRGSLRGARKKLQDPSALALTGVKEGAGALLGPFALGITVAEELRKDSSAPARALSATLLGTDKERRSAQQLEEALTDKNWVVRAAAARALGNRSRRKSIPKLKPLLDDEKDAVRYMAAASIVRLSRGHPRPKQAASLRNSP